MPQTRTQYDFLIIGYGNELRGDDAVGPQVATAVAKWQLPSVRSFAVQQLTPDLATEITQSNYVIFVDACHKSCAQPVQIDPIVISDEARNVIRLSSHRCDPESLLNLTQKLYGQHPQAWLLKVSTECFEISDQLSSTAHRGCDRALRTIEKFLTTYVSSACLRPEPCMKSA